MIIASLLAVALCYTTTPLFGVDIRLRKKCHLFSLGDHVFYALGTLVYQSDVPIVWTVMICFYLLTAYTWTTGNALTIPRYRFRLSFRISCTVWCLFAVVIVNLYSGTLTSYIMARKMIVPPRDSFEVAEGGLLNYLMVDDGIGREIVMVFFYFDSLILQVLCHG